MVVKSVRGRRRYVYLRVPTGIRRDDLTTALEGVSSAKVITCQAGDAVVRCSPADKEPLVTAVASRWPGSESVRTSGTLRTLRDEFPALRVPQKRRRRSSRGANGRWSNLYSAPFITVAGRI